MVPLKLRKLPFHHGAVFFFVDMYVHVHVGLPIHDNIFIYMHVYVHVRLMIHVHYALFYYHACMQCFHVVVEPVLGHLEAYLKLSQPKSQRYM